MKARNVLLYIGIISIVLLGACSGDGDSAEDKIYDHLEEAVTLEKDFKEQQSTITELEEKEQGIYDKILDLGMDDFEEIKELSDEAITVLEDLEESVGIEKESLADSKEEYEKIETIIDEIEDEDVKAKAEDLYDVMQKRFAAYDKLNEAYVGSLEAGKELYSLVQDEDSTQESLSEQTSLINEYYETVLEENESFNSYTDDFNELKKEFYDAAEIEVTYEED